MKFSWEFPQFIVNPNSNGLNNVITAINWVCTGTNNSVSSTSSGSVKLGSPNPAQFVPYNQITQDMAFKWVSESISIPGVESAISAQIKQISAPQIQPQNPPF